MTEYQFEDEATKSVKRYSEAWNKKMNEMQKEITTTISLSKAMEEMVSKAIDKKMKTEFSSRSNRLK